jgi:hypothetical protein
MNRERGNRLGQRGRANIVQRRKLHGLICYFSIAENTILSYKKVRARQCLLVRK